MIDAEYFKDKKLIIYGTGYVTHMFLKALRINGLKDNVRCCVITHVSKNAGTFEGIPVYGVYDINIDLDAIVCIAVHESIKNEIENIVKKVTNRYIWIYPYIYKLLLGNPLKKNIMIGVEEVLDCYEDDLRLAVRLAAIEYHDGKNDYGMRYYIKALLINCEKETAYKRLKQFMELVEKWQQFGYNKQFPITVNSSYEVIDGDHRVSMAVYTGQKSICSNIYSSKLSIQEIHEDQAMMTEKILMQNGFTQKDMEILEDIQWRYINVYQER